MAQEQFERRLSAILAADVVGFSRLVGQNEEATISRLKALRREVIDPSIARNGGRIVKTTGDGILAEFPSAVAAVRNAIEVQQEMAAANAGADANGHIEFRVGINLGDIVIDGDDILGDGVNVAARLEGIAKEGGVCVSDAAYGAIAGKIDAHFEDMGEQELKNIARPVRVWRWVSSTNSGARTASPAAPALPDKPSIAVLPFANMSGDPEQEYFTDGITEDILTELSRFRGLFVISRTTAFKYKNTALSVQEIARELGVQYVAEGSVRKAGNRVRITVQLIDAETDHHVWAERYDRDLEDIFAIQDDVTKAISAVLPGRVEAARRERAANKPTENMAAYELVLTAKRLHHQSKADTNKEALERVERAIELDPKFGHAHAWRACILGQAWANGWIEDEQAAWAEVAQELDTALSLDENDSDVHRILASLNLVRHEFDKAVFHQDRALALNPNDDLIVVQKGEILTWIGEPEEGITWIQTAMRLNPFHPERFWGHLGRAYFAARRYPEAVAAYLKIGSPNKIYHAYLAAANAHMGDDAMAEHHAQKVVEMAPDFTTEGFLATQHYKRGEDREHCQEGLLKAGLPA